MCPSTGHLLGVHCSQQPYPFHPTPPYYNHSEPAAPSSSYPQQQPPQSQPQQQQQQYLATPSSHLQPHQDQHFQSQPNTQRRQQQHPQQHLAVNTKIGSSTTSTTSSTASPLSSRKSQQQQSISQLADFAAHMVCYLLYGHQPAKPTHHHHHNASGTPPSSIPSSPLPGQGSHNPISCLCEVCTSHTSEAHSPLRLTGSTGNSQYSSSWPHYLPPPPLSASSSSLSSPLDRPTHRRILSESDIVQPKPMFRKFCLDVLSATLLSPSVILLSLKYIQQLMINLKESNKIVNTGEGAEYRFFTGALILANKFLDDNTFTNKTWADITGMKIKDVNHLEMQFLSGIEFRLFTSSWQYSEWLAKLTQFTGTYMPSQHEVAYQQQTAAAQSPISPMDSNTTVAAAAAAEVSSGSGPVRDHGHSAVGGSNSSVHPYAVVPTSSLSMTSISHYIDSVKHIQNKSSSANSRFQRVAGSTSYHHSSQLASNPTTVSSYQHQHQHQHQYQSQQQQQPQYSSLPPSGSFTSSPSSLPYAYQPRPAEPIHRKRSANIAFEDIMDRSPRYESGLLPQITSQQQLSGGSTISRHKRFSSSSSVATLMGSLSTGPDTFHNGHSPMTQQPQRYQQQQRPLSSLPQRASSGALSHSFKASGGHHLHQRSASGGNFYVDMTSAGSSPYGHESSTSHVVLSMPPNSRSLRTSGVHPLDEDHHHHHGYYTPSKSSYMPPQHTQQPPQQQQQQQQRHSNHRHRHRHSHGHLHSAVSPSYSPNGYESPCHSMGCTGYTNRNTQGGPMTYEIDPRLWGPLDSLSLYAITTQAAKRVVAQGKALSSSANGLHMYYPTTLA